jgi:hypothetical protein
MRFRKSFSSSYARENSAFTNSLSVIESKKLGLQGVHIFGFLSQDYFRLCIMNAY